MDPDDALRRQIGVRDAGLAQQAGGARDRGPAAGPHHECDQENRDQRKGQCHRDGGRETNTHLGRTLDQQQRSKQHRDRAAGGQHAVRANLRFDDEQRECEHQQPHGGSSNRQHRQRQQSHQHQDRARCARRHHAGGVEFDVQQQPAEDQNDEGQIRIGHHQHGSLPQARAVVHDRRPSSTENELQSVGAHDFAAIQTFEQILLIPHDEVGQMQVRRFLTGVRLRLEDRRLRGGRVAIVPHGQAADGGRGVVLDLVPHGRIHLLPQEDRGCRARMRARRHGGDVSRKQENEPGRGCASPRRRDEGDHRNGRSIDALHQCLRGFQHASRRIEPDQQERRAIALRLLDGMRQDVHCDGVNDRVEIDGHHRRRAPACWRKQGNEQEQQRNQAHELPRHQDTLVGGWCKHRS